MSDINGATHVYGIIGNPVTHSLSPVFQQQFLQQSNINASYIPFPVAQEDNLGSALQGLWHAGVQGLNITVPYKEVAFQHSTPDDDAKRIGAVNTLYRGSDAWLSSNTDWQGVHQVIENKQWQVKGESVLLFGAGGTARAVVHALFLLGIKTLYITNRTPERAQQLRQHVQQHYPSLKVECIAWDAKELQKKMLVAALLINSTSIGLKGDVFPFKLCGDGYALDVVYQPSGKTSFRSSAIDCHRDSVDGLPMLLAQGAASFSHWHEKKVDWLSTLVWLESKLVRPQLFRWENE